MKNLTDFENNINNGPGCLVCIICLIIIIILWQFVPSDKSKEDNSKETQSVSSMTVYILEVNT